MQKLDEKRNKIPNNDTLRFQTNGVNNNYGEILRL